MALYFYPLEREALLGDDPNSRFEQVALLVEDFHHNLQDEQWLHFVERILSRHVEQEFDIVGERRRNHCVRLPLSSETYYFRATTLDLGFWFLVEPDRMAILPWNQDRS